jgi:ankyrin repeat protein
MQDGKTAIMYAAEEGHDAIFEMLMNEGARLDVTDNVSEL